MGSDPRHATEEATTMATQALETNMHDATGRYPARVGVGVDDTDAGRAALAWAIAEAATNGTGLTVCHVHWPRSGSPNIPDLETLELTEPPLARLLREARQALGGARFEARFPVGDVTRCLLDLARTVDLLVVGGPAGDDRLHHRIPSRLAAISPQPLVVVRPTLPHRDAPFAGHVVVGVDGTAASRAAIGFGYRHAAAHRLPLALVTVDAHGDSDGDVWIDDRFLETHVVTPPAGLELLAAEWERVVVPRPDIALKRAVYSGAPVRALRLAAAGATLLVLGRHGDRLPAQLRLGSVAGAFAAHAECAVAVVPGTSSKE